MGTRLGNNGGWLFRNLLNLLSADRTLINIVSSGPPDAVGEGRPKLRDVAMSKITLLDFLTYNVHVNALAEWAWVLKKKHVNIESIILQESVRDYKKIILLKSLSIDFTF